MIVNKGRAVSIWVAAWAAAKQRRGRGIRRITIAPQEGIDIFLFQLFINCFDGL